MLNITLEGWWIVQIIVFPSAEYSFRKLTNDFAIEKSKLNYEKISPKWSDNIFQKWPNPLVGSSQNRTLGSVRI